MKRSDVYIIWPAYIDSTKSRKQGRKISINLCVKKPSLKEIIEAANRAGISIEIEQGKAYPRMWWSDKGYIMIPKSKFSSKLLAIKTIAKQLRRIRAEAMKAPQKKKKRKK